MGVEQSLQNLSVYSVFRYLSRVPWVHRARGKVFYFFWYEIAGDHADGQVKVLSVELDVMERECIFYHKIILSGVC